MFPHFLFLCSTALLTHASLLPRADPPFQSIPTTPTTPDNHYNTGTHLFQAQPPDKTGISVPSVYGPRSVDIPFALLNKGRLKLFTAGQLNTPAGITDKWAPGVDDFANQSACGIPDNAFEPSKVAIHPYWLKYAPAGLGLGRYCMQDVCISVWNDSGDGEGAGDDVELKVTDICSTDPSDPSHCATPSDIKIDRIKADLLYSNVKNVSREQRQALNAGAEYPGTIYWFFSKCWDDGLPQPVYNTTKNWFANPPLPNSSAWSKATIVQQYKNNQANYPKHGLPRYKNGAYTAGQHRQQSIFDISSDWKKGDPEPKWSPVAGGKGFGKPTGDCD
ncbi:hypothetical protein ACLMJK_008752 [Lecanora helva]